MIQHSKLTMKEYSNLRKTSPVSVLVVLSGSDVALSYEAIATDVTEGNVTFCEMTPLDEYIKIMRLMSKCVSSMADD